MRAVIAIIGGISMVTAIAFSAREVPSTKERRLAIVAAKRDDIHWPVSVRLNNLPLAKVEHPSMENNLNPYVPVPDLLLKKGRNVLTVTWDEEFSEGRALDLSFVELASEDPERIAAVLWSVGRSPADAKANKPRIVEFEFDVSDEMPKWQWTKAPLIEANPEMQKKLVAAAHGLAKQWESRDPGNALNRYLKDQETSATRAGMTRDQEGALLRKWISHPDLSLDLRADDSRLEVIGDGRLARLMWDNVSPWMFRGGLHDAPQGQMGPVNISFEIWFRLDGDEFVPAAVWQTGIAPDGL